jgi:hypothetical protein
MTDFTAYLRGSNFRPITAKTIVAGLQGGEGLLIEREPHNQFDPNAIMVLDPETREHLGYVAKEVAVELAPLMDEGRFFSCRVDSVMMKSVVLEITETQVPEYTRSEDTDASE